MSEQTPVRDTAADRATPVLEARGLSKSYGHVQAMVDTDFDLMPGEVLAVEVHKPRV